MDIKQTNKKRAMITMLFFLVAIIAVGLVGYGIYLKKNSTSQEEISQDVTSNSSKTGITSIKNSFPENSLAEADSVQELDKCLNNSLDLWKTRQDQSDAYYLAAKALMGKNIRICSETDVPISQTICSQYYNRFSSYFEKKSFDAVDCKKMQNEDDKNMCLAISNKDISKCEPMSSPLLSDICKANVTFDPKYCENISSPIESKGACRIVLEESDSNRDDSCGIVSSQKAIKLCYSGLYFIKALKEKNIDICDKIDQEMGKFDFLLCRVLISPDPKTEYQNFYTSHACYERYANSVAKTKNDPSICEKIPQKAGSNNQVYTDCMAQFK